MRNLNITIESLSWVILFVGSYVFWLGEIMSTSGFDAEKQYIFYEVFIPEGWSFEDYNEYEVTGLLREETSEFNKRNSSTHIS